MCFREVFKIIIIVSVKENDWRNQYVIWAPMMKISMGGIIFSKNKLS